MAVRVKIRVSSGSREVVMPALVNSGYETENPELLVPTGIAQALGLWPETKEAVMERYRVAGGVEIRVVRLKGAANVEVLTEDYVSMAAPCDVVISEGEEELIISDKLAGSLGLSMIDIGEGSWCFKKEIGKKVRKSY